MRLSVVSVVSFQGLFGVEVRTYKVLTKNTSTRRTKGRFFAKPQGATLYVREDLVNTFAPATERRRDTMGRQQNGGKRIIRQIRDK